MNPFSSINPATGESVWTGPAAMPDAVALAVARARAAFPAWSGLSQAAREDRLRAFAAVLETRRELLAEAISREIGKPAWEAHAEVAATIGKIELAISAHARRCGEFTGGPAVTRFRPHGVVGVLGPFNFPAHLPNGHIAPALLAGNTVVFKPSEQAPLVADLTIAAWRDSGLPNGVLELVQGGRDTGAALADSAGIDGLFFTGSAATGRWLAEKFARSPEKILALEMGGNNPLVVWQPRDLRAAALLAVQSAFLSAGQRCTCARRLIVPNNPAGAAFLTEVVRQMGNLRVGPYTERPQPFMGPVISAAAAETVLAAQRQLIAAGAVPRVAARQLRAGTGLLAPGLLDVTAVAARADAEIFGPLLQVIRVEDFPAAVAEANATRYGLSAGLIADDPALYERFRAEVRAGLINWNHALTGASSAAPFGGVGHSGNHRPSGFFAADSCAYPVASIESPQLKFPSILPPGLEP